MDKLVRKIQSLNLKYSDAPQPDMLIAMPNPYAGRDYRIEVVAPEFTALCPINEGQPDFATITIKYVPDKSIIEFKSLKLYLTSYRTVRTFYEESTNRILEDLVRTLKPKSMEIVSEWNVRGGMSTRITAAYNKSKTSKGG
ncbi:MAG: NADPH-dependent 7-cyano-7-deazaguanine reductase QueF [Dehalococcoidia bacterium]|nr:NADPH-dependent 7-cyano-7-deazaguanine reductase QueF [Dehalococcoidia bacterium]